MTLLIMWITIRRINDPSAPTLSQVETQEVNANPVNILNNTTSPLIVLEECTKAGNQPKDTQSFPYRDALNTPSKKSSMNKPNSISKKLPVIITRPYQTAHKHIKEDSEGFTIVSLSKNRNKTIGTRKPSDVTSLRGATKYTEIYVGRCNEGTTPDMLKNYMTDELSITPKDCKEIETKIPFSAAFKIAINNSDIYLKY